MNNTTKRWLSSGLAMLLALCLVFGAPTAAFAAETEINCELMEANETATDAVLYCTNAQKIVDVVVREITEGEYAGLFQGSATPSSLKSIAVNMITSKLDENEDLMIEIGFEPTAENKALLAEEIYYVACIYYDDVKAGNSKEHANTLAILEIVRFALVEHRGYDNDLAVECAGFFFDLYTLNNNKGEEAAVSFAAEYLHNFENDVCTICGDAVIYRLFGANRYATAFTVANELKAVLGVDKFEAVVVACGTDSADALSGSYLAAKKNAPILLTNRYNVENVQTYIKENMAASGTVYILGGEAAVSATFEEGLAGLNVKRLQGGNRFETSLAILNEAGVEAGQQILVCTGLDFADSLSASATGMPIMLVRGTYKLFDTQKAYLDTLGTSNQFVIVGGVNAVNETLAAELQAYGTVERLAGNSRFETSTMVAEKYFATATDAVLAYARNFPDGLCGGPLANALKAPLILTQTNKEAAAVDYVTARGIKTGYVLGGAGLLANSTVHTILGDNSAILVK